MDEETSKTRKRLLEEIYRRAQGCEGFFLDPDYLQTWGIQASQIEVSDGVLPFQPCFFLPNQVNILEYPIEPSETEIPDQMFRRRSFPSLTGLSESDIQLRVQSYYEQVNRSCSLNDWNGNAREIACHMSQQIGAMRVGLPHGGQAGSDFMYLSGQRPGRLRGAVMADGRQPEITLEWELEEIGEDSCLPHAIAEMTATVPANYADQSITPHEVECLVSLMWSREARGDLWRDKIQPLLLISYMGQRHGRITQAICDGERLTLQYSPLFLFKDKDQASVELFLRYLMCIPVSPGEGALPFRPLGQSVDGHWMDVD